MGEEVHDRERRKRRAGGDEKRHEHGEREAEDHSEDQKGGQDGDQLSAVQVGLQDRGDVVLERRGAGDLRGRQSLSFQSQAERSGLEGGFLQVERGADLAVDEPGNGAKRHRLGRGHGPSCGIKAPVQGLQRRRRLVRGP